MRGGRKGGWEGGKEGCFLQLHKFLGRLLSLGPEGTLGFPIFLSPGCCTSCCCCKSWEGKATMLML
jgi:hypothetical protein